MSTAAASFEDGPVRGFLHRPERAVGPGIVLTHGAGGNCQSTLLVSLADKFCASGLLVLRCDLAFRQRRAAGPPIPALAAQDRDGLGQAAEVLRRMGTDRVFLGGHSYGGRQATILASEVPECANALLLLSYPLHPPKKPEQLRTAHFPALRTDALFVHGTRDAFGTLDEMRAALLLLPAKNKLLPIDGAGHDLRGGKSGTADAIVSAWLEFVQ